MIALLPRRIAGLALTLLVVSLLIFAVMDLLPGDPASIMLGTSAAPETLAALRHELGLDQPLLLRYLGWLAGVFRGDLGQSYTYGVPVAGLIFERLAVTLPLALMAIALSVAIAIPLGVLAASRRGGVIDAVASVFSQVSIAVPAFWVALLLIILFSTTLGIMPAGGFPGWSAGVWPSLKALIMPSVALALPQAGVLTRVTRSAVLDTMHEDFTRTAKAKGLSARRAVAPFGAERDDPDPHHPRPAVHLPGGRRRAGRKCLQPAGAGAARLSGAVAARHRRHAGCRAVLRGACHRHEFHRRSLLSGDRSPPAKGDVIWRPRYPPASLSAAAACNSPGA
jgi:peptide/nickel transport system permease protein